MRRRWFAAIFGVCAVVAYLVLALVSGRLSVLARRPLLDSLGGPPPYNWVCSPPDFASVNRPPTPLAEVIDLKQQERGAGLHSTPDRQAELVFDPGTFPASLHAEKLTLKMDPLCLSSVHATPPGNLTLTGNAYRISLTAPKGKPAPAFATPVHLVLLYPTPTGAVFVEQHTLVRLSGSAWTALKTTDAPAAQQATADVTTLGTFAVAFSASTPSPTPKPAGGPPAAAIGGIVAAVVVAGGVVAFLVVRSRRQAARRAQMKRRGKGRR